MVPSRSVLPSAPDPGRTGVAPAAPPIAGGVPPRARGPRSRKLVFVAILVAVVLVASSVSFLLYEFTLPSVHVSEINVYAPDDVCGLEGRVVQYAGFSAPSDQAVVSRLQVPNFNGTECIIETVTTNTSGFGVSSSGTPLTIAGNGDGVLSVTLSLPSGHFSGVLNLIYR